MNRAIFAVLDDSAIRGIQFTQGQCYGGSTLQLFKNEILLCMRPIHVWLSRTPIRHSVCATLVASQQEWIRNFGWIRWILVRWTNMNIILRRRTSGLKNGYTRVIIHCTQYIRAIRRIILDGRLQIALWLAVDEVAGTLTVAISPAENLKNKSSLRRTAHTGHTKAATKATKVIVQ
jgi:hypothetical protein